MTEATNRWDVAISFASPDEAGALELRDRLQPPHSVFVYSKAQANLAGRDGVEAFRIVFREQTSLVVILYARPWGETPWTRVEKEAIEEYALEHGWEHLMFVRLKSDDPVPKWVPKPHLYLDMTTFSLPDLVGAIKLRLAELGVETRPVTPAERATAQARRRTFDAETIQLLNRVPNDFDNAVNDLCEAIKVVAGEVATGSGWQVDTGPGALGGFVVTTQSKTVRLVSLRRYTNSVDDACLELQEFDVEFRVAQPGQRYASAWAPPEPVRLRRMPIRRLPELGWCWELDGHIRSHQNTAESIVHILLDRMDEEAGRDRGDSNLYDEGSNSIEPD